MKAIVLSSPEEDRRIGQNALCTFYVPPVLVKIIGVTLWSNGEEVIDAKVLESVCSVSLVPEFFELIKGQESATSTA